MALNRKVDVLKQKKRVNTNMRLVAKKANVSIATVSRFINSPEKLSQRMQQRVGEAMQALGYIPNELAKALFSGVSKVVGLILPSVTNPFFAELATQIERHARTQGDAILLMNIQDDPEVERDSLTALLAHRVSAIIVCRSHAAHLYTDVDIPVVCFENPVTNCQAIVRVDNEYGGYLAFRHLMEIGCRRVLHIKGPAEFGATEERYQGFMRGFNELPVGERPQLDVYQLSSDFAAELSDVEIEAIPNLDAYDGAFAFNDIIATTLLRVLNRRHIRVPEQMKIIGFDGSYFSQMTAPSLSTITQHVDQIAVNCMEAVWQLRASQTELAKKNDPAVYTIQTELVIRDSTRSISLIGSDR